MIVGSSLEQTKHLFLRDVDGYCLMEWKMADFDSSKMRNYLGRIYVSAIVAWSLSSTQGKSIIGPVDE